jgi:hypothetical protein
MGRHGSVPGNAMKRIPAPDKCQLSRQISNNTQVSRHDRPATPHHTGNDARPHPAEPTRQPESDPRRGLGTRDRHQRGAALSDQRFPVVWPITRATGRPSRIASLRPAPTSGALAPSSTAGPLRTTRPNRKIAGLARRQRLTLDLVIDRCVGCRRFGTNGCGGTPASRLKFERGRPSCRCFGRLFGR